MKKLMILVVVGMSFLQGATDSKTPWPPLMKELSPALQVLRDTTPFPPVLIPTVYAYGNGWGCTKQIQKRDAPIVGLSTDPSNSLLVVAYQDARIQIFNWDGTLKQVRSMSDESGPRLTAFVMFSESLVVAGYGNGKIQVFNLNRDMMSYSLKEPNSNVPLAFTLVPDSKIVVGYSKLIEIRDLKGAVISSAVDLCRSHTYKKENYVGCLSNGNLIVHCKCGNIGILVCNEYTDQYGTVQPYWSRTFYAYGFAVIDRLIAKDMLVTTCSYPDSGGWGIQIIDLVKREIVKEWSRQGVACSAFAQLSDSCLLVGYADGKIEIINIETGTILDRWKWHESRICWFAVKSQYTFAVGYEDGAVEILEHGIAADLQALVAATAKDPHQSSAQESDASATQPLGAMKTLPGVNNRLLPKPTHSSM